MDILAQYNKPASIEQLVRTSQTFRVIHLLTGSKESELVDDTGSTLMHLAARYDNVELVKYSLFRRIDPNCQNWMGRTPLMIAVKNNQWEVTQYLVRKDVDVYIVDNYGYTALKLLMFKKDKAPPHIENEFMQYVNRSKVPMYKKALLLTTSQCSYRLVWSLQNLKLSEAFLKRKPLSKQAMEAAMESAAQRREFDHIKLLMKYDPTGKGKSTLLYHVVTLVYDEKEEAEEFIEQLLDWKAIDDKALPYLHVMVYNGSDHTLDLIWKSGIADYVERELKQNLLFSLIGNPKMWELDQNEIMPPDSVCCFKGWTPVHCAASKNLVEAVQFLIKSGFDINARDDDGMTPLFTCLMYHPIDGLEVGMLLLREGADVQAIDNSNWSLIQIAMLLRSPLLMTLIIPRLAAEEVSKPLPDLIIDDFEYGPPEYLTALNECRKQVMLMRGCALGPFFTLFEFFIRSVDYLVHQVNDDFMNRLNLFLSVTNIHSYYRQVFMWKREQIVHIIWNNIKRQRALNAAK